MPVDIKIPALGESVTQGLLTRWHVKNGDTVTPGQLLYDLETDKISSEGFAQEGGTISLLAQAGDTVAIGQVVARVEPSLAAAPEAPAQPSTPPPTKAADPAPSSMPLASAKPPHGGLAVERLAWETGLDPSQVCGTGPKGRVTKHDMLEAAKAQLPPKADRACTPSQPSSAANACSKDSVAQGPKARITRTPLTPLRRTLAQRLVTAQHEAAMLTTFNEVDLLPVMTLRKKYQDRFVERHGTKLGLMSFFVKAVVRGLQTVPQLNARLEGQDLVQHHYYDIAVAVGTPRGLVVPVLRDCDRLSFAEIEKQVALYAQKAKDNKLALEDLQGGVFTISNGGVYGSMLSTPILNHPQCGILGMHSIKDRAVVVDGQVVVRPMMYLALTYDHRIVDGKEAVTFLVSIKDALEDPVRFVLEV
jgi:2-oxoglutarate dehydrogenase E2 component (dihydrolipoamide succinyltransferase)